MKTGFCVKIMVIFLMTISGFGQKKVACIGDSITYGAGISNKMFDSYPSQLQQLLGYDYEVKNFGVSGRTLLSKGDFPWIKEKVFTKAKNYKPDIVVIKLGTNDTKPQNWQYKSDFKANFKKLLASFPRTRTLVCLPVPAFPERWGIRQEIIANELIPILKELIKENHLEMVDLHTPFLKHPEFFPDKIHPNEQGARRMAEFISEKINGKVALGFEKTKDGLIKVRSSQACTIKYTLDGSIPSKDSPSYQTPLRIENKTTLRAAAYIKGVLSSRQFYDYFPVRKTHWKISSTHGDKAFPIANLIDNNPDSNWVSSKQNSSLVITFSKITKLNAVSWMKRYKGRKISTLPKIKFSTSLDGNNWQTVTATLKNENIVFKRRVFEFSSWLDAKHLKLAFDSPVECAELDINSKESPLKPTSLEIVDQSRDAPGYFTHNRHSEILNRLATQSYDLIMIGDSITHQFGGSLTERTYSSIGSKPLKA